MLGNRLKALRCAKGMTQQELADKLEISPSAIGMYERGKRDPDHETLTALCRLFGVSTDYFLLEDAGDAPPSNAELNEMITDFRDRLLSQEGLMFNGVLLSENDIAQVVSAIEVGTMVAVDKIRRGAHTQKDE